MPIYQSIYDIIATYLFGSVSSGTYEELVCIATSTFFSIAIVALPFVALYSIIRGIVGGDLFR